MAKLDNFYKGKKVLITGNTGFKGSWLSFWLTQMGAEVFGIALRPTARQSILFNALELKSSTKVTYLDIRELEPLQQQLEQIKPDIIFHLAAQPVVKTSYLDPMDTYTSNMMGTLNLLEALRVNPGATKAGVFITTDKCYKNIDSQDRYTEACELGGHDPYSSSKACCELIIDSYRSSYFNSQGIGIASARGGNILGGGDFGEYRLLPDIVQTIQKKETLVLRSPQAMRPWQYVLDALYGYLLLGMALYQSPLTYNQAFNFSNSRIEKVTVLELVRKTIKQLNAMDTEVIVQENQFHETTYLQLDASKARIQLKWKPCLDLDDTLIETGLWYSNYLNNDDLNAVSVGLINRYRDRLEDKSCTKP